MALAPVNFEKPYTKERKWIIVAYDPDLRWQIALVTNIPIVGAKDVERVCTGWRYRPQIKHTYRFDQEQGWDVEGMRVRTLERMRRMFVLVRLVALFVYWIAPTWPA